MNIQRTLLKNGFFAGIHKGWSGFVWMIKILVPISFLTAVLAWSGWIERGHFLIQPVMSWLSLPSLAALPLMIGMLTGIYGGIAAMAVLPFTREQMTLIAIFLLIAHNLIQEGVIQGKCGLHPLKATLFRLVAACLTVMVAASFLNVSAIGPMVTSSHDPVSQTFAVMLRNWLLASIHLTVKIFVIIMSLLIVLEILKSIGWIDRLVRLCRPLLKGLGLSEKGGIIWMTAAVFGLAYGAAVIVEEAGQGHLAREELEGLHLSIGINHSLVEDPALFLAFGLSAFWLWVPRLITAMLAVRLLSLWQQSFKNRRLSKSG